MFQIGDEVEIRKELVDDPIWRSALTAHDQRFRVTDIANNIEKVNEVLGRVCVATAYMNLFPFLVYVDSYGGSSVFPAKYCVKINGDSSPKKCNCDVMVLMSVGCKCGGS